MKQPPQIQFLGMDPSPALETEARERLDRLERFCPDLISCRTTVELLNTHQQQGRSFAVRLDLTLPGHELTVSRVHHEDAYVALRHAFDGMTRQIEDTVRLSRRRHERGTALEFDAGET